MSTKISGIYIILNKQNNKFYLGQSHNIKKRLNTHKNNLRSGKHPNKHLQAAWNKYGESVFKFQMLEYCSVEQLNEREQYYLDIYSAKDMCYNVATDAISPQRGRKYIMNEDTKRKIGNANRGRKLSDEHRQRLSELHRHPSEETRRRLRDSHIGKVCSPETRAKMSEAQKKRGIRSEETKQRMSVAQKGKILSEEHKRKLSVAHKGKTLSKEHKQKIAAAGIGRIFSEETRKKISEANKRRKVATESTDSES